MNPWMVVGMVAATAVMTPCVRADDPRTDSRSQFVHRIKLYDHANAQVDPAGNPSPYSPKNTCGKCHNYEEISHGWHFNALKGDAAAGRRGEAWFYTDYRSGTQLPLSYRDWAGTFKPGEVGVTAWQMAMQFGRHMPGGGAGDPAAEQVTQGERWGASGRLEIDCMTCHAATREYDARVFGEQIAAENYRWAATAALGIGHVSGSARNLPADYDPASADEQTKKKSPTVAYDAARFDSQGQVFFDVIRRPPDNRCYYCHTAKPIGSQAAEEWVHDGDVHLRAGMSCVDCHRNGLGHHTVRGFVGEQQEHPSAATLSCVGCHMGPSGDSAMRGGRLGSPKPLHKGIPPLHFERMSCTSCHSGPQPASTAGGVQTSMAHNLGEETKLRTDLDPPGIAAPVFVKNEQGIIEPHRMMWPAYWGHMKDGKVTPMDPQQAYSALRRVLRVRGSRPTKAEGPVGFEPAKMAEALMELSKDTGDRGAAVYIAGGKAYRLAEAAEEGEASDDAASKLVVFEHDAAKPYSWPLAHDVRPARQALGVGGCRDCHAAESPLFYATVASLGPALNDPAAVTAPLVTPQHELLGWDTKLLAAWEKSFEGHTSFKAFAIVAAGVLGLLVLRYALLAFGGVAGWCAKGSRG